MSQAVEYLVVGAYHRHRPSCVVIHLVIEHIFFLAFVIAYGGLTVLSCQHLAVDVAYGAVLHLR